MARTPVRVVGPVAMPTVTAVLYTVPAGAVDIVTSFTVANTDIVARTVTVGVGGTTAGLRVIPTVSVPASTVVVIEVAIPLAAGEALHGLASAAAVTLTVAAMRET